MNELANKLLYYTSSSTSSTQPSPTHHFILRQSSQDSDTTNVSPIDQPQDGLAVYTIQTSKKTIILYRGEPNPQQVVGECKAAFMGLSMHLSLRGSQFSIRNSTTGTKFIVESPSYGRLVWKGDSLLGSGLSLYKTSGEKVATIKSGGILNYREKQLLLWQLCGNRLLGRDDHGTALFILDYGQIGKILGHVPVYGGDNRLGAGVLVGAKPGCECSGSSTNWGCNGPMYPVAIVLIPKVTPRSLHVGTIGFAASFGGSDGAILPFAVGAIAQGKGVQTLQPIVLAISVVLGCLWLLLPRKPMEKYQAESNDSPR
ncbi:hypothetical protein QWA68_012966 [Fusarium oxysporum]|nr:hypothetical protein QWA68_012966 [Fusarium oxysporum]